VLVEVDFCDLMSTEADGAEALLLSMLSPLIRLKEIPGNER